MSTDAVDNVTNAMANTTISDQNKNQNNDEAVLASAAEGRRLYIGNLAYATTEEELKEFFKGFLVESISIPINPRTSRPVGYAFVDVSTPTEAERAINELSGQEVQQRKVSVQFARKPESGDRGDGGASGGENGSGGEGGRRRFGGRGRGRGRGRYRGARGYRGSRGGRADGTGEGQEEEAPTNVPGQVLPLTESTNESSGAKNGTEGAANHQGSGNDKPRGGYQGRKQRGPPEDGIVSKTKVMVANLPYDLTEDKLKELFNAYEPTSAKVALRPIPRFMVKKLLERNEPRKGRGFGFVTLSSEEMQQKAIAEMNGKEVEGREIAVKVAIDSPGKEDDDGQGADATAATTDQAENGAAATATT